MSTIQTDNKQTSNTTALSLSVAMNRLDRIVRATLPRYWRQLPFPASTTARALALRLEALQAITANTDLGMLHSQLVVITTELEQLPAPAPQLFNQNIKLRVTATMERRIMPINDVFAVAGMTEDAKVAESIHAMQRSLRQITDLVFETAQLLAMWGATPNKVYRRPSPVVHC